MKAVYIILGAIFVLLASYSTLIFLFSGLGGGASLNIAVVSLAACTAFAILSAVCFVRASNQPSRPSAKATSRLSKGGK